MLKRKVVGDVGDELDFAAIAPAEDAGYHLTQDSDSAHTTVLRADGGQALALFVFLEEHVVAGVANALGTGGVGW